MDDGKDEEILKAWAENDVDSDGSPEVETGQHNNLEVIKEFVDGVKEEVCSSDLDAVKVKEDIALGKGLKMKQDVDVAKKIKKEIEVNKLTSSGPIRSKSQKRLRSISKIRKRSRSRSKSRKRLRSRSKSFKKSRSRSWDYRKTTRRKRNSSTRSRSRSVTKVQSRRSSSGVRRQSPKKQYNRQYSSRQEADKPQVSNVLGAFGLSSVTRQTELEDMFGKHGKLEKVNRQYSSLVLIPAGHPGAGPAGQAPGLRLHHLPEGGRCQPGQEGSDWLRSGPSFCPLLQSCPVLHSLRVVMSCHVLSSSTPLNSLNVLARTLQLTFKVFAPLIPK